MKKEVIICDICHAENSNSVARHVPVVTRKGYLECRLIDVCPRCLQKITRIRIVDFGNPETYSIVNPELDALLEMAREESAKAENNALHANDNLTGKRAIGHMEMADEIIKKIIALKGESK